MFQIENIIRDNIKTLVPYTSARDDFTEEADIYIDANENPYETGFNRYPDPRQQELREEISKIKNVAISNIFLGNGSDEIIDLLMRSICEPKRDNIITFSPSYTMYETTAQVNDVEVRLLVLNPDFSIPVDKVKSIADSNSKILFICSPNNPVGTVVPISTIEECCQFFKGIVVVDEAYIDFTTTKSASYLLEKYPNLVVIQTLSKAYGMAGLRVGMCFASEEIVYLLYKVKQPYNVSTLSQIKALEILKDTGKYKKEIQTFISERERLFNAFTKMDFFTKVYPSEANFILVSSPDYKEIYKYLTDNKIVARLRNIPPLIPSCIRFSVGTVEENTRILEVLRKYKKK